ncbi:MAG: rod shape-determining protein MreD [Chloroflexi bacterium]|nr:rod shape-determining protein MreD [Chloroflexota bacterium]
MPQPGRSWGARAGAVGALLLVLVLGLLQTSVLPSLPIAGIRPALVLMAVITLATVSDDARAAYWGFLGGLLIDLLSAAPVGVNALIFTLLVYIVGGQRRQFDRVNPVFPVLAGAAATLLYYPAVVLTLQLLGFDLDWGRQVWERLPRAVAVNAGATVLLYPAVRLMDRWTRPQSAARYLGRARGGYFS